MISIPEPRAAQIRAAILAHPELDDRAIAKLVDLRLWNWVRQIRAALAAPEGPPADAVLPKASHPAADALRTCAVCGFIARTPGGLSNHHTRMHAPPREAPRRANPLRVADAPTPADDAPAPVDAPPPSAPAEAAVICANCGRAGTRSRSRPDWCVACGASPELAQARAAWADATPWRCDCGRHFARSTREPARCIKCTGEYDRDARRHRVGAIFAAAD